MFVHEVYDEHVVKIKAVTSQIILIIWLGFQFYC